MSPTMQTLSPSMRPRWSRMVSRSRSALRRVLVPPVSGVDDVRRDPLGEEAGGAGRPVADDDHVDPHGLEVPGRVDQRLALRAPTSRSTEMLTVSALRRFSANSNEMRVRVDASKNRLTMVLPRSTGTFLMRRSEISLKGSAVSRIARICSARQRFETDEVFAEGTPRGVLTSSVAPGSTRSTPSRPSSSGTSTSTLWWGSTSTYVRPTMSGWIGSSRPPRSTSTQSRIAAGPPPVDQLVEGRPPGPARVGHVVDEDHGAGRRCPSGGSSDPPTTGRGPIVGKVVPVQGDVDGARRGTCDPFGALDLVADPARRSGRAPPVDTHERRARRCRRFAPRSHGPSGRRHGARRPRPSGWIRCSSGIGCRCGWCVRGGGKFGVSAAQGQRRRGGRTPRAGCGSRLVPARRAP